MSPVPPSAPPPPPLPHLSLESPSLDSPSKSPQNNYLNNPSYAHNICEWGTEHQQLWEACAKYNICLHEPPYKYKFTPFESILQVGPTCGLVALSMLVSGEVTPDEILDMAKEEGYSCNGEMFSCKNMLKLMQKVFRLADVQNVRCCVRTGGLYSDDIIEKLLNGAALLVPYDAYHNHSPCLRRGHTAHWALICGVIVCRDPGDSYTNDPSNVFVFSRHGKSRYLAAWRLDELSKSNKNLWEFSPKKETDGLIYVLPEGGIGSENGLRNKFLIVEGLELTC